MTRSLFSDKARWIWDGSDRSAYNHYVRFRRSFRLSKVNYAQCGKSNTAILKITADAYYQVWLNGQVVGHGPAKSAQARRSVDTYCIAQYLQPGRNVLDITVLSVGTGTMTYCLGHAGLIYELTTPDRVYVSDGATLTQSDTARRRDTVRRWMLPCVESIRPDQGPRSWQCAKLVDKRDKLYPRRVALPSRQRVAAQRIIAGHVVGLPDLDASQRLRPYLASVQERTSNDMYYQDAIIVTDIISPVAQTLTLLPTICNITWYFNCRRRVQSSGWGLWDQQRNRPVLRLKKGRNRLIGLHQLSHMEDFTLSARSSKAAVTLENPFGKGLFQVIPVTELPQGETITEPDWTTLKKTMPSMNPQDSFMGGNPYARLANAKTLGPAAAATALEFPMQLPPAPTEGQAGRVILDLGVLVNGWLEFEIEGREGQELAFVMFEALDEQPELRIQWPVGSNNALTYKLTEGRQTFESFFHYGVRYIAVYNLSKKPTTLHQLAIRKHYCGKAPQGAFRCSDELLNQIYTICVQSVQSGSDDTITDCPTYEQVNWNMDNRLAAWADLLACGNRDLVKNSLLLFTEDPDYRGLVRANYPSSWKHQIPLWSFHWIMACRDYYDYTADKAFVRKIMPQIRRGLEDAAARIGSWGLAEFRDAPGRMGHVIEWGHGRDDDHAINTAEQGGFVGALTAAEQLAQVLGQSHRKHIASWQECRQGLIKAINQHLWSSERQAYVDSLREGEKCGTYRQSSVTSQTTNAQLCVYGCVAPGRVRRLAKRIAEQDITLLACGSPMGMVYVLELLGTQGYHEQQIQLIRRYWGDMVRAGDTTTWEVFGQFGDGMLYGGFPTRSRCHPYSAYVLRFLVETLLGLKPMQAGFEEFTVRPHPLDLSFCEGAVLTPAGPIDINWTKASSQAKPKLNVCHPKTLKIKR